MKIANRLSPWHGFSTRAFFLSLFLAAPVISAPVEDKIPDRYTPVPFDQQHLSAGLLADRMKVNLEQRLLKVDEKGITDGFVHRPGSHPWIGEHAGKFLHAAANTYAYTHDPRLKELMDRVAVTLISAQLPDGYLGTYTDDQRWTSWDVWSHKYDLLGLLAWYDVTHDDRALACCQKIGDLLCNTFGDDAPGKKDISAAGTHVGMAATSVLEPMCYLYRHTGDKKYLDFCLYITRSIEKNSKVISSLTAGKGVHETANAKSYEMLSNLVGLVELYRLTGDKTFLTPALAAWTDIITHDHLYLTGSASTHEHFLPPGQLPGGVADDIGEGCVTVTWQQLNLSLLRLTGETKYADELERTIYNQLLAAQHAENGDICYYTPMIGDKPFGHAINCCLSSEPRGIALIPAAVWGTADNAIDINLYAPGRATFSILASDGQPLTVQVTSETDFPKTGKVKLTFAPSRPVPFPVFLRRPAYSPSLGLPNEGKTGRRERVDIDPAVSKELTLTLDLPIEQLPGGPSYPDHFAFRRGPQLLAFDRSANPDLPVPSAATVTDPRAGRPDADGYVFPGAAATPDAAQGRLAIADTPVKLIPFADTTAPRVWLPTRDRLPSGTLPVTFGGAESYSRTGNRTGSITDLLTDTMHVTFNRKREAQDWYAVEFLKPAPVRRVVFRHGHTFHDGGWFDASAGKPQVQVKASPDASWRMVATLDTYPATTATDAKGLADGQTFEVTLPQAVPAAAVRVVGKPASGDRPRQSFSSCSELAAYSDEAKP